LKLEWDFLLGNIAIGDNNSDVDELPWLFEERRSSFINMCNAFPEFASQMKFHNPMWQKFYKSESPEKELDDLERHKQINFNINTSELKSLSARLKKLILIQVFRPDRLETAMKNFLCDLIGIGNLTQTAIGLENLLEEVEKIKSEEKKTVPILFITTLGSDPSKELEDFANKEIGSQNYIQIPMGAGDNEKITISMKEAAQKGLWICLKNLHLSVSWLSNLEKYIKNLKDPHPRFKIFLTSESHNKFSPILLQMSKKIAYETPPGVKKNLERIYQLWQANNPINQNSENKNANINNSNLIQSLKYQACFSLAFIHALLQERRTYIPQGWTKFYEFSYSDLKVSSESMINYLENCLNEKTLPTIWKNIKGLIVNSYYGGRIDNEFDFEIMKTYIEKIFDLDILSNTSKKILNVGNFLYYCILILNY